MCCVLLLSSSPSSVLLLLTFFLSVFLSFFPSFFLSFQPHPAFLYPTGPLTATFVGDAIGGDRVVRSLDPFPRARAVPFVRLCASPSPHSLQAAAPAAPPSPVSLASSASADSAASVSSAAATSFTAANATAASLCLDEMPNRCIQIIARGKGKSIRGQRTVR